MSKSEPMWLQFFLILLAVNIFNGNSVAQLKTEPGQVSNDLTVNDARLAITDLKYNMHICMGDQNHRGFDSFVFAGANEHPNPDLPESIKTMLDTGFDTFAGLYDMKTSSGLIFELAMWAAKLRDKTTSEEILNLITVEIMDISEFFTAVHENTFLLSEEFFPQLYNFMEKYNQILSWLFDKWYLWAFALNGSTNEYKIRFYKVVVAACQTSHPTDWLVRFNATMHKTFDDGSGFPQGYFVAQTRNRRLINCMARAMKSIVCEATIMIGTCDKALNASGRTRSGHLAIVFDVYKHLAERITDLDRDLVINARNDIARTTHYIVGEEIYFRDDLSLAEQIRRQLKFYYYWLDFTVIIFEAESMYGRRMGFTEYSNETNNPCVISTGHIGALNGTWKSIVFVAGPSPRNDINETTWTSLKGAVENCRAAAKNCGAQDLRRATSQMTDSNAIGMSVPNYFATIYALDGPYIFAGPAVLPGRIKKGKEEVMVLSWPAVVTQNSPDIQTVTVIAATDCDRELYVY